MRQPLANTQSQPGPMLVTSGPQSTPTSRSLLSLWHLLSLDAPTVAVIWTIFVAHCEQVVLPWTLSAAMFIAVWMLYAADRLLDARPLLHGSQAELQDRHWFHHHHRGRFVGIIVVAALPLILLLHTMDAAVLHLYTLLAVLLAAWLLVIHALPQGRIRARRLPKELAVGAYFPAAIFIPTYVHTFHPWSLLPSAFLLGALCTLNCLFITAWERNFSFTRKAKPAAQTAGTALIVFALTLAAAAMTVALSSAASRPIAIACALSTGLLLVLNARSTQTQAVFLRAAADLALLTPLFFLPWQWLNH